MGPRQTVVGLMSYFRRKPPGGETKRLALLLIAVGLSAFCLPLASAKLAFLNATESSSLGVASGVQAAQIQAVHAAQIQTLKAHHDEELPFVLLFFAILLVLMLVFVPGPLPAKPLGGPRKRIALGIITLGVVTFVLPMVTLDPPVLNRAQWSPVQILSAVYAGELPVAKGHFDETLFEAAMLYLLMIAGLGAVYLPRSPKPLTVISLLGFVVSSSARFWHLGFMFLFNSWEPGGVRIGLAGWILPWVMPALFALCFAKSLDVDDDITDPVSIGESCRR